ncbi:uncharacterized protein LOC130612251 [Hydractinia symbiolongicarpus]|uniref:uncharacterized protein LOC130612251 n=1 Tax=Hydractinia symbiolongicarpus TaxID=13093 RepID=UPI00254C297F|nr:uncharacterized protein LOC130612251 [Hydractinia symbiolongicarpus]
MRWLNMTYFIWIYLVYLSVHIVICTDEKINKTIVTDDGDVFETRDVINQQINDVSAEYLVNKKKQVNKRTDETFFPGLTQQIFKDLNDDNKQELARTDIPVNPDEQYIIPDINLINPEDAQSAVERIYGYFKPPEKGEYIFKISSKGESTLTLSTSKDKNDMKKYADVEAGQVVDKRQYDKYENQNSRPIPLNANQMYYMEVVHKKLDGASHLQLGALFPNGEKHFPLESRYFYTVKDPKEDNTAELTNPSPMKSDGGSVEKAHDPHVRQLHRTGKPNASPCGTNLRVRLYSTNFNCLKRKGHICKYALSGEDRVVKLRPREAATTFVITKPGLNNYANSISFQVDGKHGIFLLKDGDRYIVASNDGSKDFASLSSFNVDSQDDIAPASYGIRLFQTRVSYLCHGPSSTDIYNDRRSPNCAFYMVPVELDMNSFEPSCNSYCPQENLERKLDSKPGNTNEKAPLNVLDALAHHTADVEAAKYAAKVKLMTTVAKNPTNVIPIEADAEKILQAKHIAPINLDEVKTNPVNKYTPVNLDKQKRPVLQVSPMKSVGVQPFILVKSAPQGAHLHVVSIPQHNNENETPYATDSILQSSNPGQTMLINSSLSEEQVEPRQQYIALHLNNNVGTTGDVRIISSIKPEGYVLGKEVFKLKILFKHKYEKPVVFHGVDESSSGRTILLNGQRVMKFYPTADEDQSTEVSVTAVDPVTEVHAEPSNMDSFKDPPPGIERPKPAPPVTSPAPTLPPLETAVEPTKEKPPNKANSANPPDQGHITSISGVARTHEELYPPMKISNAVDESIDLPVMIEKKQYHRPAAPVDENAKQKDGVPDVMEISYDDDNGQKKTITEILVDGNAVNNTSLTRNNKNPALLETSAANYTGTLINTTSIKESENITASLAGNKTVNITNSSNSEEKETSKVIHGEELQHMEHEVNKTASLLASYPSNDTASFQNQNQSDIVHYDYIDFIGSENETTNNTEPPNSKIEYFAANKSVEQLNTEMLFAGNNTQLRNETSDLLNNATYTEPNDADSESYSVIKSLDETQKELRELNSQIEKLDKESDALRTVKPSENTVESTVPDVRVGAFEQSNEKVGFEAVRQYEQSGTPDSWRRNTEQAVAKLLPEEEIGSRSEKKTITASPDRPGGKQVLEDGDTVVGKKNILNTIKALEENNYRSKVKSLSNFLKEYTNEDEGGKQRYEAWLAEHQHPNSWYYGIPVGGVKRSPFNRKKSFFHSPASPTDPVVIHDDDTGYMKRYNVHPQITFPRQIQFHDDKRAKIPNKPPAKKRKTKHGNKRRRYRRSLCDCAQGCADDKDIEACLSNCENKCSPSLVIHEKENTRERRNAKYLGEKKNASTVFDEGIVNDIEEETAFTADKNKNGRKSYISEEDDVEEKRFRNRRTKKASAPSKKSVIPIAQRNYAYPYSYNFKNMLPLKRAFVEKRTSMQTRPPFPQHSNQYTSNLQTNTYTNKRTILNDRRPMSQYYISPQYYMKSYVPQQTRYQSFQRWYQPQSTNDKQASFYYNNVYPTQRQYYAKNIVPGASPYYYGNYARYYQQNKNTPLFYARNGVPAKPADVKAKIPAHKTPSNKRIVSPVKYIHDEELKMKKFKVQTGAKRMLVYPNHLVRKPAETSRPIVRTVTVMRQTPVTHPNITIDENKTFTGNVEKLSLTKNTTKSANINKEHEVESMNQEKHVKTDKNGNDNKTASNGEKRMNKVNKYKAALMPSKSGIPYYARHTESGSKRNIESNAASVSNSTNATTTSSISNETVVDLKETFEKYLNKDDVVNNTAGNVTNDVIKEKGNMTKTGESKSKIVNKIMEEEKKGSDERRRNSYFAIEIAEDEDENKPEPTEKEFAKKKTSDLETAKKEIEKEEKARESLTDKNGGIENVIFDNNVDVSSVFFRHDAKLNRNHEQNTTGILKDIENIQPASGKGFVNHTGSELSYTDAVFPTQSFHRAATQGYQDVATKPYIGVESPNKAYVKQETVNKAFLHHDQPTKLFSLDVPTLRLKHQLTAITKQFNNIDNPTKSSESINSSTQSFRKAINSTQSYSEVDIPTQQFHKLEYATEPVIKSANPTLRFHRIIKPTRFFHNSKAPTKLRGIENITNIVQQEGSPPQEVNKPTQAVHKEEETTKAMENTDSPSKALVRDTKPNKVKTQVNIVNATKVEAMLHNKTLANNTKILSGEKNVSHVSNATRERVKTYLRKTKERLMMEKLHTPKEIEAVYTDRIDGAETQRAVQTNFDETETNMPYKAYSNHDNVNGDWFDTGFQPDVKTKQDIKMSKSGFLNKLLKPKDRENSYDVSPTSRQVEDKIKNIVNAAEFTEQSELQNLIKESIGTALNEEQATLNGVNTKHGYKNMSDLVTSDADAEASRPPKSENGEMAKIMSDFKDELALNEQDPSSPMIEDSSDKGDIMRELKVNDQQEYNALKSDLEGSLNQKERFHAMKNFTDIQDVDDETGEKKHVLRGLKISRKKKDKSEYSEINTKVSESEGGTTSLSAKSATTKPEGDVNSKLKNENSLSFDSSDERKETTASIFPTAKEHNYRKYQMETNSEKPSLAGIEEKWKKVKEQNKHIAEEEDERLNEEMLSRKNHTPSEDKGENKNGDLLSAYFKEIEGKTKLSEGKELNLRQEKRQKKIKATLAMINDIESQIDGMIHASDKVEHKKAKKRGKAAIFTELTGNNVESKDSNYGSGETHRVASRRKEKIKKTERIKSSRKLKKNERNEDEDEDERNEELEDADDDDEDYAEEKTSPKRKHATPKTDDDEYEDEVGDDDHFERTHKQVMPRKHKHQFEQPITERHDEHDENSIANVIASNDQRVRQQQASELLNLQKQEVNEDLLKLKEVTQDGLQSMFAKAVAKQQKFMDDIQGPTEDQSEDLIARDQLQDNPYNNENNNNEKQLMTILGDQMLPYQREQNEIGNNYNFVNEDEIPSNRKSEVEREREDLDDDLLEPEDNGDNDDFYDDDRRRRTVNLV